VVGEGQGTGEMEVNGYCQVKGREGKGKEGRRRGGEGRKVRTPPSSIPAFAPGGVCK